ncbi:hypothetical protein V8G54_032632 [Vigna mungo]|uniref:Protein kinase domain-containing protein n=1 Tax=Vigna mungo TaxID=3915 RepID=A0AAQ3MMT2_VIGMU
MNGQKIKRRVGKYEVGRTIGEGTFAKVKFARNSETGEPVALKIIDKEKVLKYTQAEQVLQEIFFDISCSTFPCTIKAYIFMSNWASLGEVKSRCFLDVFSHIQREIATTKLIKHPNVERINFDSNVADGKSDQLCYELNLLAYCIMQDFISFAGHGEQDKNIHYFRVCDWGELFHKISVSCNFVEVEKLFVKCIFFLVKLNSGWMSEKEARRYFQQLINAVDYWHSRGVYYRDLKLENLLLDAFGNLKISDFGLSALSQQVRDDGLLHTTCGTPNYVAPEVQTNYMLNTKFLHLKSFLLLAF